MQIQIPIELLYAMVVLVAWVEYRAWSLRGEIKSIQQKSERSAEVIEKKIDELTTQYKRHESALDEIRDLRSEMRILSHQLAIIKEFKELLTPDRPRPWDEIKKEQSIDLKKEG